MARRNGKSDPQELDAAHELPASDDFGGVGEDGASTTAEVEAASNDSEVQRLRTERDELLDRLSRLQAEFENARKRASREQQEFRDYALADALKTLLPVLDSFERALQERSIDGAELRAGVELIYKQLHDALAKLGLRPIPAQDEPFDPHLHEAIEMVETTGAKDQHVLEELQRGYKLKDRLLRPSMVRVAKNSTH